MAITKPQPNNFSESNEPVFIENPNPCNIVRRSLEQHYPPGFFRKVVAEIIATYLLLFVTCGSAALSTSNEHIVSKLGASVAEGLIVTVMNYVVGHIFGAHMNPAITLAIAVVPIYAAAQVIGAISSSFTLSILLHPIKNIGTTTPKGTNTQSLLMEIFVTFSMMFITFAVAIDTRAILVLLTNSLQSSSHL
ncbi:hypothetical protein UlMin_036655 [Ulmus minor]